MVGSDDCTLTREKAKTVEHFREGVKAVARGEDQHKNPKSDI